MQDNTATVVHSILTRKNINKSEIELIHRSNFSSMNWLLTRKCRYHLHQIDLPHPRLLNPPLRVAVDGPSRDNFRHCSRHP